MKLVVVIPAYNETKTIGRVVKSLPKRLKGINKIETVVVNDGSLDDTAKKAKQAGAIVVNHKINMGVGAATATGFEVGRRLGGDIMVTMDGDGQHDVTDLPKLLESIIKKQVNVVVGTRLKLPKGMPWHRKLGNRLFNFITRLLYRIETTDSQSGFRAYDKKALGRIKIHTLGYEYCTEVFGEIKRNNLKFIEIPIRTIYTNESRIKGQPAINGINIMFKLISRILVGTS